MHGLVPAANGMHLVIQAADLRRRCGVSSEAGCSAELQRFLEIKIGYPNSWMVYFMENPIKVDENWGYPDFRKPPNWGFLAEKGLKTHRKTEDLNEFCRETWGNMGILSATTGICVWYIRRKLPWKRCRTVNFFHYSGKLLFYLFWVITHLAIHLPSHLRLPGHARQSPVPSSCGSPSCILWVATSDWSTGAGVDDPIWPIFKLHPQ